MKKTILIAFLLTSIFVCIASAKSKNNWTLKGAIRSEAMVTLSFVSKEQELLPTDHQAAQSAATQQCSAWGFTGAELNGEIQRFCDGRSRFGKCKRWEFTIPLQCTGGSSPTN
ncbi:YecR family lipoprotein [Stenotrophomonas koreensis]|uniref:YecR family lipoprotein n=1 Tax=Stenotrophomonas koreensis TaxID=266128 RepID=UPI0013649791|nr:YecR family lipoprotein [Stenotrophomonas koreensis]